MVQLYKSHESLKVKVDSEKGKWFQKTPAMAEKLTDHVWSLKELLMLRIRITSYNVCYTKLLRWWIVSYEDEEGVYKQARIDAVTGEVYTGYDVPARYQTGGRFARGAGFFV